MLYVHVSAAVATCVLMSRLNAYFKTMVEIPRITRVERQELETLISEEALLFPKCLRNERPTWSPWIVALRARRLSAYNLLRARANLQSSFKTKHSLINCS